jgi:iron(III) transport system ATP-binding protein
VDAVVRERLRLELIRMQRALGFTAIYVTHDQDEAMHLADRIAVMVNGRIHQLGEPVQMYSNPRDVHVARFLGSSNEFQLVVQEFSDGFVVGESTTGRIRCRWDQVSVGSPPVPGDSMVAFGRLPDFKLSPLQTGGAAPFSDINRWSGEIETSRFLGTQVEFVVRVENGRIRSWRQAGSDGPQLNEGDRVVVEVNDRDLVAVRDG